MIPHVPSFAPFAGTGHHWAQVGHDSHGHEDRYTSVTVSRGRGRRGRGARSLHVHTHLVHGRGESENGTADVANNALDENRHSHGAQIAQELALQVIGQDIIASGGEVDILDFGFESGEFYGSRVLQPHVNSVVGTGVNASAIEAFGAYAASGGLTPEKMRAIAMPYMGHLSSLEDMQFDVIIITQPIDQRPDISNVIPALAAQVLKPGGALYVAVLDMSWPPRIRGQGEAYESPRVEALFEEAGLEAFELTIVDSYGMTPFEPGQLYIARGFKNIRDDFSVIDSDAASTVAST
ncbi:hypothetical protein BKA62DRAFT_667460 [Auriculariales sp. MPI-PUGE-AT-0066]|nr:hypothetical protein BKA62DRAFT_667460 [Auriculariales sp. MPI-PUGE-AT-0066]